MPPNPEPPLSSWTYSNEAPPDPEMSRMQQQLDTQLKRLSTLNAILRRLPVPALFEEHTQLEESIESYKMVLHPNRRIPPEILQLIFRLCLPKGGAFASLDPTAAPLVFTQVCRAWRAVALNTRELWSSLRISTAKCPKPCHTEEIRFSVDNVKLWLARAKQKPMAISLNSPSDYAFEHEVEYLLPRAILDHSLFIRELHLNASEALLEVMVGGQLRYRRSWPLLTTVSIYATDAPHTEMAAYWVSYNHNPIWEAPKLKSVTWDGVSADPLRLMLNWDHLEALRLSGSYRRRGRTYPCSYGSGNIRQLLQATPKLVSLEVSTDSSNERLPDDWFGVKIPINSQTVLRHLTTLTLDESCLFPLGAAPYFFHNLQLPALLSLKYRMSTAYDSPFPPSDQHPLVLFLQYQRHPVLIETWDVCTASISPLGIVECLKLMPRLQHLSVSLGRSGAPYALEGGEWVVPPGDWMLEALYRHGQASLCPGLRAIIFEYCEFTLDGIRAFIDGRRKLALVNNGGQSKFVRVEAIDVCLKQMKPIFVPRDPAFEPLRTGHSLAQCELEEELRDMGVEAYIRFVEGGGEAVGLL